MSFVVFKMLCLCLACMVVQLQDKHKDVTTPMAEKEGMAEKEAKTLNQHKQNVHQHHTQNQSINKP